MKQHVRILAFATAVVAASVFAAPPASAQQGTENDPFFKPVKPKPKEQAVAKTPERWQEVPFPSLDQRTQEFQGARQRAKDAHQPEPNPAFQYLVREVNVLGIYEMDGRQGVFVEAGPQKNTFFLTPGTRLYNGELVEIQAGSYPSPGRAVFRERTDFSLKKQRKSDIQTVIKTVGQQSGSQP